jgi:hypothetical protein
VGEQLSKIERQEPADARGRSRVDDHRATSGILQVPTLDAVDGSMRRRKAS